LVIAAVLGTVAAILVLVYLSNAESGTTTVNVATTPVVVAAQAINVGERITADKLATREVPTTAVAADSFRDSGLVVGQVARYPIATGEAVTHSRLVEAPKVQAISFQIPPGLRGMTIPVNTTVSPAALTAPGDFVDVLVSVQGSGIQGGPTGAAAQNRGVATLMQNIQVLSVGTTYINNGVVYEPSLRGAPPADGVGVGFVTLAVTPEQAQILWLAQDSGRLKLLLRPFGEDSTFPVPPVFEPLSVR
jgi:pilus assembly protein CpaB